MCGRYVIAYDPEMLVSGFSVLRVPVFPKRWNVAPLSEVPVVYETRSGERVAELMRWGLVPSWAADPAVGAKLNNARAEGLFDKPSFRQAARRRRCLLPASGFYEWQALAAPQVAPAGVSGSRAKTPKKVKPPKQPWFFSSPGGEPLAMAGLFEAWRSGPASPWLLSCCVITCEANAVMAPVHERMPVLLAQADWARWLSRDGHSTADIAPLLSSPPAASVQCWPVSRVVSHSASEGAQLVQRVAVGENGVALPDLSDRPELPGLPKPPEQLELPE